MSGYGYVHPAIPMSPQPPPPPPPPPPSPVMTWDPINKGSDWAMSNGNLTATFSLFVQPPS